MIRRSSWYSVVALVSALVLLVATDVCLLVTCAPRARAATPRCSHCAMPSSSTKAPLAGHGADTNGPCCVKLTLASAPSLAAPVAAPAHFAPAMLAFAVSAPAPVMARFEPPRDEAPPPTRDGFLPRAERGPPSC